MKIVLQIDTIIRQIIVEDTTDKLVAERQIVDPVWLMREYNIQNFKIEDAINFHKELARPEMLDNMEGFLNVRFLLDMTAKKKVKIIIKFGLFLNFFSIAKIYG